MLFVRYMFGKAFKCVQIQFKKISRTLLKTFAAEFLKQRKNISSVHACLKYRYSGCSVILATLKSQKCFQV